MIEYHQKIFELFKDDFSFTDDNIQFLKTSKSSKIMNELEIECENIQNRFLSVNKLNLPIMIFENISDFFKLSTFSQLKETLIINNGNNPISYSDHKTYINFIEDEQNYIIKNAIAYYDFIEFLKSKDNEDEKSFHFIDYFNQDFRKIVLTSLSDKGRVIIKYENEIPTFDKTTNLSNSVIDFTNCFKEDNNHLPKFLKNSLIDYASRYISESRLQDIVVNLHQIVLMAKMNFEVYLNNLSIDAVKKDYDEFRSKYFKELSDILSKMTNKIIGLPIGISATLYAINKINDNPSFLILLSLALLVTLYYICLLLKINFKDINYISKVYIKDYNTLKNNKFFKLYPDELNEFDCIKERISERIKHLKLIIESYFWVLGVTNIVIIGFILSKIGIENEQILLISLIELILLIIMRINMSNKKNKV
ncbi:MAG: hypothetical protein K8S23_06385 [Candidatus Cloacimonetes bacterium]|nr:hypothetical protein [Candidatus Cloacimonadota bacterium]